MRIRTSTKSSFLGKIYLNDLAHLGLVQMPEHHVRYETETLIKRAVPLQIAVALCGGNVTAPAFQHSYIVNAEIDTDVFHLEAFEPYLQHAL